MASITFVEVFTFILLFSSCLGRSHETEDFDNIVAEGETETGDLPPWLLATQKIEGKLKMFESTLLLLDATINSNTHVLTKVESYLEEVIARPPCNFSTIPATACCQSKEGPSDKEALNKTDMALGIEIVPTEPAPILPNESKLSDLQKSIRSLLTSLKQNYTFSGALEKYDKEIFGN